MFASAATAPGTYYEQYHTITTSESYQPAAAVILEDPGVQKWMARLSPDEQRKFVDGLRVFVWGLDVMTE